jgi:hypothetical protein
MLHISSEVLSYGMFTQMARDPRVSRVDVRIMFFTLMAPIL